MPKVIDSVDWKAFRKQKEVLHETIVEALEPDAVQGPFLEGILNLMDALQDAYQPAFCPHCGGTNTVEGTVWTAYSNEDEKNTCQITEYQCLDCDAASFWK